MLYPYKCIKILFFIFQKLYHRKDAATLALGLRASNICRSSIEGNLIILNQYSIIPNKKDYCITEEFMYYLPVIYFYT